MCLVHLEHQLILAFILMQLLVEDPALKRFKSHKKGVWRIKRMGDVLTIVVVAGMQVIVDKVEKMIEDILLCSFW